MSGAEPDGSGAAAPRWRLRSAGPGGALLEADAPPSPELSRLLAARRAALWSVRPRSVHDLIPAYTSLLAEYRAGADAAEVAAWLSGPAPNGVAGAAPRRVELAVRYGDRADAAALQSRLGLPWDELVRLHARATYTVAFVGFMPGFPYLLGLPEELHLPRRSSPRAAIDGGAVAIADGQAGVYPRASPGGWWVLGHTDAELFDPFCRSPALLATGDEVRFVAAGTGSGPEARATHRAAAESSAAPAPARGPPDGLEAALEVLDAWHGAVTLQARPRWGVGHHGLAQVGPLDTLAHAAAQDILGAARDAAVLEATVPVVTLRALADLTAVVTGGGARVRADGRDVPRWRPFSLRAGATLELTPEQGESGATSYLAVAGGLAAMAPPSGHPDLVESHSTDARGGIGAFGRALRAGDTLALAGPPGALRAWHGRPRYGDRALLRLHPGPQVDAAALESLLSGRFVVASRDRTGARLEGPPVRVDRHDVRSQGVPWGAVQVPADGGPIVLLADRGRTGGYAVPAVVDPRDLWQLAQARPGCEVWFVPPDAFR